MDREARRRTTKTLTYYREQLQPFIVHLSEQGVDELDAVTPNHIRSYLVSLQRRGLKDTSQHAAARAIRGFFNFTMAEGLLAESPMRNVEMPERDKRILPAFTPDDVRKLLDACYSQRDVAMVLCLLDTGCRAAEFVALTVGDVDLKTGATKMRSGKGRWDRTAFIGAKARKALMKYMMGREAPKPDDGLWMTCWT